MALKALMLRKKIDDKKQLLKEVRDKAAEFDKREAELETAIKEAETDEEKQAVEEAVEKFEKEKSENEESVKNLEAEVSELESELKEVEERQDNPVVKEREGKSSMKTRAVVCSNETRTRFYGMNIEQREAFFRREDVRTFVDSVRSIGQEKRSVTGSELLIPEVVLELIHSDIEEYSKLYKYVNVKPVKGKARQNVMGAIPEGVWTEMSGKINEVNISFGNVEVDGYKVGAFISVPNDILEDSDIALGTEIIQALGKGLGLAIDKAILYGPVDGKMPTGIYPAIAADNKISTINVKSIPTSKTDIALFKAVVEATAVLKHSIGNKFWAMNSTTKIKLLAASLGTNTNAAIVAGMNDTMPVIGGDIIELDFIPDNVIIGGYGERYLLAERAGTTITTSSEYQFIEDNTVYKATARYDGKPVFNDSFMVIAINGVTPSSTAVTFVEDKANKVATEESASE